MNPDYNTLLRFYKAATGNYQPSMMNGMNAPQNMAQDNVLPPQTVIQVQGKPSVEKIRMSPNSSVLLMDVTAPIVWLSTSDGLGNVTSVPYDISEHKEEPPVDVESLETRLATMERMIEKMLGGNENVQSDDAANKSRTNELAVVKSK